MICRFCKQDGIPDRAPYCCWCGKKLLRDKQEIKIPEPKQLPSGSWRIQLRRKDQPAISITEPSAELCRTKARAIVIGIIQAEKKSPKLSLGSCVDAYISARSNTLSPSTIRGYRTIRDTRFSDYMSRSVAAIPYQRMINEEAAICSAKTLKSAWSLVSTSLRAAGAEVPDVTLPRVPRAERPWLSPEQIPLFLSAAQDRAGELPALLALHSLRRSELAALTWEQIDLSAGTITVSGALLRNEDNDIVRSANNKTSVSARTIPILIPRLRDLLEAVPADQRTGTVYPRALNTSYASINAICDSAGLPSVGVHGLRHTFASLCYHLKMNEMEVMRLGGWADFNTVHRIYTHLSDRDAARGTKKLSTYFNKMHTKMNTNP